MRFMDDALETKGMKDWYNWDLVLFAPHQNSWLRTLALMDRILFFKSASLLTPEKILHIPKADCILAPTMFGIFLFAVLHHAFHDDDRCPSQVQFSCTRTDSGVFKRRRARHLPRAPPFWLPPLRCYEHKFSVFLMQSLLFTHIMY